MSDQAPAHKALRTKLFRLASVAIALFAALMLAETVARIYLRHVNQPSTLDPGFIQRDPVLGWVLTPNWKGRHTHHDFDVVYHINSDGFRADSDVQVPRRIAGGQRRAGVGDAGRKKVCAVVGDSFAFGMGVNDNETFVHLLNQMPSNSISYVNWSVPGYSTDQEALLIERQLETLAPDFILLAVYLGNDLLDNMRQVPLHVRLPKPWFTRGANGLEYHGPIELRPGDVLPKAETLATAVLGTNYSTSELGGALFRRSALVRFVSKELPPAANLTSIVRTNLAEAGELLGAILDRIKAVCDRSGVSLAVMTIPGQSFVANPNSISSQYQGVARQYLLRYSTDRRIANVDIGNVNLGFSLDSATNFLFFPNDGHITPAGHKALSRVVHSSSSIGWGWGLK